MSDFLPKGCYDAQTKPLCQFQIIQQENCTKDAAVNTCQQQQKHAKPNKKA